MQPHTRWRWQLDADDLDCGLEQGDCEAGKAEQP
jgi:hypothetical protein